MVADNGIRGEGRQRLIEVAAECYSHTRSLKVSEVCDRAGVSIGTVYHHFPRGVADLEAALYLDTLTSYQEGLLGVLERHRSAAAGVKAIVAFHLEWMAEHTGLAHFLLFYSAGWLAAEHKHALQEMNMLFATAAVEWGQPHVRAGRIRDLAPEDYGPLVLAPAQQYGSWVLTQSEIEDVPGTLRAATTRYAEQAWAAVKGS